VTLAEVGGGVEHGGGARLVWCGRTAVWYSGVSGLPRGEDFMPVPKKKTSQARRDQRRAQQKLSVETASTCPQCKSPKLPHRACPKCGTYKGREVIVLEAD